VLADKGHKVVLYESGPLGGQLNTAVRHDMKFDLKALQAHLIYQVRSRRSIQVVPERASAQQLISGNYDHILLATGRAPAEFDGSVSGALSVIKAADISDPQEIEGPVVVIGAGMTGCDTAVWLQNAGKQDVTVIDEADGILSRDYVFTDLMGMPELLHRSNIKVQTSTKALAVEADGVRIRNVKQQEALVVARTVIIACGYEAVNTLEVELAQLATALSVDVIGTARQDGRVMDALHDAFFTARRC
jgi:2-enoate reductase